MTADLDTIVKLAGLVATVATATGWVIRQLVLDRIARGEASIRSFGARLQELREWQIHHDAVELERARVRRDTRGVPRDGE